jgi:hypothetical protein
MESLLEVFEPAFWSIIGVEDLESEAEAILAVSLPTFDRLLEANDFDGSDFLLLLLPLCRLIIKQHI